MRELGREQAWCAAGPGVKLAKVEAEEVETQPQEPRGLREKEISPDWRQPGGGGSMAQQVSTTALLTAHQKDGWQGARLQMGN